MIIRRFVYVLSISLLFVSMAQGQISIGQIEHASEDHHAEQDSAYHCGLCSKYLFDSHEGTSINDTTLHYHGIGTDESTSPFKCAGCDSHLGFHNHEEGHYEVLNDNVSKKEDGKYYCKACQLPLFEEESVEKSDESSTYFHEPIGADRIEIEDHEDFYKVRGSHLTCKNCNGRIGAATGNDSRGFGLRLQLGNVNKKKRSD